MSCVAILLTALQSTTLTVGPGAAYPAIGPALAAARPGDTVRVAAGVYRERPVISRAVVLLADSGAVIDGGGDGTVLTITAPATVRGFVIRGSGANQSREDAGILATGATGLVVERNRLEDVLFGVYVKQSDRPIIRNNVIVGKQAVAIPQRGDGIRLWYSHHGLIERNRVRSGRDVVIWFSNHTVVRGNRVEEGRYGLHYMYSDSNAFEANAFVANHVGAFIMYSSDITFRNNLFADARGTTGRGLGFKDSDRIVAVGNVLVKNAVGISIDNSPTSVGVENSFRDNVIAYNDIGVSILPAVHSNEFRDNAFLDNVQPIYVTGGGTAMANRWEANYWSDYAGFDGNGDGFGDTPYRYDRLSDDLLARHESLRLFNLSLAVTTLNTLSRVLPHLQPEALVLDSAPRRSPGHELDAVRGTGPTSGVAAAGLAFGAVLAAVAVARLRRGMRPLA